MTTAFPLAWPTGWPRTKSPTKSSFKQTPDRARRFLVDEIARLGGSRQVISTNQKLRLDGAPYAGLKDPADKGVAVYFQLKGKPMVFACDRFDAMHDNLYAIGMTISALRGIERWGASQMMERAFQGFTALPPAIELEPRRAWWEVLDLRPDASLEQIRAARLRAAKVYHPDCGTSPDPEEMAEVNAACDEGEASLSS